MDQTLMAARLLDRELGALEQGQSESAGSTALEPAGRRRFNLLPDKVTPEAVLPIRAFRIAPLSGYDATAVARHKLASPTLRDLTWTGLFGLGFPVLGIITAAFLVRRFFGGRGDRSRSGLREVDQLAERLRAVSAEQVATEATLKASEARLRDLIGTLDLAAIMACEACGTIRFWSQGCRQLYGWSREETAGRSSHDLLHTQFPVPMAEVEQVLLSGGEWSGDLVQRRRDGTMIVVAARKTLKQDPDGLPHMVIESLVDVTALREAQGALETLHSDLERRVKDEVAAREEAQQQAAHADRVKALGQLAGGIAHDFNNVLQAVAGGAALIARRPNDVEAVTRLIRVVREAASRGASITRRMLVLARRGDLRAEPIEVLPLLDDMREVFLHTLGPCIDIRVEVGPGLPRLLADKVQLEAALMNLGTNACDAMPDGGRLQLIANVDVSDPDTRPHPAGLPFGVYVCLSVTDTGMGMSSGILARAGEPFFTTKDVGKGTGLGLSMVKGFADQSGGAFLIKSIVGDGTQAILWLPSVIGEARQHTSEPLDEGQSRLTGRILLVDNDDLVRDTLTEQLQELGHKVLPASGASNALAILGAREAVDLLITDLSMPGMDGVMLIKQAQCLRPSLPAILLTGYAGDALALARTGVGRNAYVLMRKPTTTAILSARVTALLERS